MATIRCIVCAKRFTSRADGLCDSCWRARQAIEVSECAAYLSRIVVDCERDWALMDRIDGQLARRDIRKSGS